MQYDEYPYGFRGWFGGYWPTGIAVVMVVDLSRRGGDEFSAAARTSGRRWWWWWLLVVKSKLSPEAMGDDGYGRQGGVGVSRRGGVVAR